MTNSKASNPLLAVATTSISGSCSKRAIKPSNTT
ncbi:Uncharacterised protein [Vibrio cholerae]|nr:Uncharacterised protein [Vibrio cholerae]